ncbi:nuclear transport factor 2 family protein [Permianibacter sp. IMCC34836]|uniref:nuclear transport factor 2 family protein n=1 Tax=Permianibacter fluminis TaxID=2738515 RepID=UPI00155519B8|nr:nuclear transport factor 2 family protein [Permianibacter fluminis]NQD36866.1 nuclear transport factor 2 family protein [Permianibacter fluminis]
MNLVANVQHLYRNLHAGNLDQLSGVYADNVLFIDPFHRIEGLPALKAYFAGMYSNVRHCDFQFERVLHDDQSALIRWTMSISHPRLNGGRTLHVPGVTELEFTDRISLHRDFFDAGALLYEQVPVIGWAIRRIKERIA